MVEWIARPLGLFKAGKSGVGGQIEPMTPMGMRYDLLQRLPEGILYGLEINTSPTAPTASSMIIDVIFDGKAAVIDSHLDHTVKQVTDYPIDVAKRGLVWFCSAEPPKYGPYTKVGPHSVTVKVAPRKAPVQGGTTLTIIPPPGTMKKVTTTTTVTTIIPPVLDPCTGKIVIPERTVQTESYITKEVPVEPTTDYIGYSVMQDLGLRDFSPEAGGRVETFPFNVYAEEGPAIPYDEP